MTSTGIWPPPVNVWTITTVLTGGVDVTASVQAQINAAAGRTVYFPKGTYQFNGTVTIPAGTTLWFDDATIVVGAANAGGVFAWSAPDVSVTGTVTVNFAGFATPCFKGSVGGDRCSFLGHFVAVNQATVSSANNYLFNITQCNQVRIGGLITTPGNSPFLVFVDRGSHIEVSDVTTAPLTVTTGSLAVVNVQERTGTGTQTHVSIHDCLIDGGGVLAGPYGAVVAGTATTAITTSYVTISNVIVTNTLSTCDGVDVVLATNVTVTNCVFDHCNDGISVSGSNVATVTDCVATNCRGAGFAAGDNSITFNTNGVTFTNCQAWACGTGATGGSFFVFCPNTFTTNAIHFENCYSAPSGVAQYDLQITGNGGGCSDVTITGGTFNGGTVGHINDTVGGANAKKWRAHGVTGLQPVGSLGGATPAIPASPATITNGSGTDVTAILSTGAGVTVTAISIGGTLTALTMAASSFLAVRLTAGQSITLTYAGGTPTWNWFGD